MTRNKSKSNKNSNNSTKINNNSNGQKKKKGNSNSKDDYYGPFAGVAKKKKSVKAPKPKPSSNNKSNTKKKKKETIQQQQQPQKQQPQQVNIWGTKTKTNNKMETFHFSWPKASSTGSFSSHNSNNSKNIKQHETAPIVAPSQVPWLFQPLPSCPSFQTSTAVAATTSSHSIPICKKKKNPISVTQPIAGIPEPLLERLDRELMQLQSLVRLTPLEVKARQCVTQRLQDVVTASMQPPPPQHLYGHSPPSPLQLDQAQVRVFGSFATLPVCCYISDIDVAIGGVVNPPVFNSEQEQAAAESQKPRGREINSNSKNNKRKREQEHQQQVVVDHCNHNSTNSSNAGNVNTRTTNDANKTNKNKKLHEKEEGEVEEENKSKKQKQEERLKRWLLALEEIDRANESAQGEAAAAAATTTSAVLKEEVSATNVEGEATTTNEHGQRVLVVAQDEPLCFDLSSSSATARSAETATTNDSEAVLVVEREGGETKTDPAATVFIGVVDERLGIQENGGATDSQKPPPPPKVLSRYTSSSSLLAATTATMAPSCSAAAATAVVETSIVVELVEKVARTMTENECPPPHLLVGQQVTEGTTMTSSSVGSPGQPDSKTGFADTAAAAADGEEKKITRESTSTANTSLSIPPLNDDTCTSTAVVHPVTSSSDDVASSSTDSRFADPDCDDDDESDQDFADKLAPLQNERRKMRITNLSAAAAASAPSAALQQDGDDNGIHHRNHHRGSSKGRGYAVSSSSSVSFKRNRGWSLADDERHHDDDDDDDGGRKQLATAANASKTFSSLSSDTEGEHDYEKDNDNVHDDDDKDDYLEAMKVSMTTGGQIGQQRRHQQQHVHLLTKSSRDHCVYALKKLKNKISRRFKKPCQLIPAKVPILKLELPAFQVDIAIEGCNGADTSSYAGVQVEKFQSFAPVVLFLKVLLAQQMLDTPFTGGLGSYKLYVLVAYHIQKHLHHGGNDRPGEVLLSLFLRYGRVKHSYIGDALVPAGGGVFHTHLSMKSDPLKCRDGGTADLSNVHQLPKCVKLFEACWDRLRTRLQAVESEMLSSNKKEGRASSSSSCSRLGTFASLLDNVVDGPRLFRDRQNHMKLSEWTLDEYLKTTPATMPLRGNNNNEMAQQRQSSTNTTTSYYSPYSRLAASSSSSSSLFPVDRTAEQLVAGYSNVAGQEFLQEHYCRNQQGSVNGINHGIGDDQDDVTPRRSNKRARLYNNFPTRFR